MEEKALVIINKQTIQYLDITIRKNDITVYAKECTSAFNAINYLGEKT